MTQTLNNSQEEETYEMCDNCFSRASRMNECSTEVCDPPHLLIWARMKGRSFWPAKVIGVGGMSGKEVYVRFFGNHKRSKVAQSDCLLYTERNPNESIDEDERISLKTAMDAANDYMLNLEREYSCDMLLAYSRCEFEASKVDEYIMNMIPVLKLRTKSDESKKSHHRGPTSRTLNENIKECSIRLKRCDEVLKRSKIKRKSQIFHNENSHQLSKKPRKSIHANEIKSNGSSKEKLYDNFPTLEAFADSHEINDDVGADVQNYTHRKRDEKVTEQDQYKSDKSDFMAHKRMSARGELLTCGICAKGPNLKYNLTLKLFSNKRGLFRHIRRCHNKEGKGGKKHQIVKKLLVKKSSSSQNVHKSKNKTDNFWSDFVAREKEMSVKEQENSVRDVNNTIYSNGRCEKDVASHISTSGAVNGPINDNASEVKNVYAQEKADHINEIHQIDLPLSTSATEVELIYLRNKTKQARLTQIANAQATNANDSNENNHGILIQSEKKSSGKSNHQWVPKEEKQRHRRRKTKKGKTTNDKNPFTCDICGFSTPYKANIKLHMPVHTRSFICDICGISYTQKNHLRYHMNNHIPAQKFECHLCNYQSLYKYNIDIHMSVHEGNREFRCHLCSANFSLKHRLTTHLQTSHIFSEEKSEKLVENKSESQNKNESGNEMHNFQASDREVQRSLDEPAVPAINISDVQKTIVSNELNHTNVASIYSNSEWIDTLDLASSAIMPEMSKTAENVPNNFAQSLPTNDIGEDNASGGNEISQQEQPQEFRTFDQIVFSWLDKNVGLITNALGNGSLFISQSIPDSTVESPNETSEDLLAKIKKLKGIRSMQQNKIRLLKRKLRQKTESERKLIRAIELIRTTLYTLGLTSNKEQSVFNSSSVRRSFPFMSTSKEQHQNTFFEAAPITPLNAIKVASCSRMSPNTSAAAPTQLIVSPIATDNSLLLIPNINDISEETETNDMVIGTIGVRDNEHEVYLLDSNVDDEIYQYNDDNSNSYILFAVESDHDEPIVVSADTVNSGLGEVVDPNAISTDDELNLSTESSDQMIIASEIEI